MRKPCRSGEIFPNKWVLSVRIPLKVKISPHHREHRISGKTVLSAAEALGLMACVLCDVDTSQSRNAELLRFVPIDESTTVIDLEVELTPGDAGWVGAELLSRQNMGSAGLKRMLSHLRVQWGGEIEAFLVPEEKALTVEGEVFRFSAQELYADLVPFGSAFQNVVGDVLLANDGAVAKVKAPWSLKTLGSPFPIDACMHLACAWSQRYLGKRTYPMSYKARRVFDPTKAGELYTGKVEPRHADKDGFCFDLWVFDELGNCRDSIIGLNMQGLATDKSAIAPWVMAGNGGEE